MSRPDSGREYHSGSVFLGAAVILLCCLHADVTPKDAALMSQAFVPSFTLLRFFKVALRFFKVTLRSSDFSATSTA